MVLIINHFSMNSSATVTQEIIELKALYLEGRQLRSKRSNDFSCNRNLGWGKCTSILYTLQKYQECTKHWASMTGNTEVINLWPWDAQSSKKVQMYKKSAARSETLSQYGRVQFLARKSQSEWKKSQSLNWDGPGGMPMACQHWEDQHGRVR